MSQNELIRCEWAGTEPLYVAYHDNEWGTPVHDERELFEMLILEGAQAGLSWSTILNKRENYRQVFDDFNPSIVVGYDDAKVSALLADPGIVRNRLKVESAIRNAKAFLEVQEEYGSVNTFIWGFVKGEPIINSWKVMSEIPAKTPESEAMNKELKQRGFNFVGPTICYAFMQSIGMVNDHVVDCFRYAELKGTE